MMQRGGGILVAIGLIAGSVIGVFIGQPSAGLVIGLVVGLVAAGLLTLWDTRRR
jgi:FtsH-binding integral membrane protein